MSQHFSIDYSQLQTKLTQKKAFKLADVQHRLKRVAFDVVRFVEPDHIDKLWKIETDESSGDAYIVAMYDEEEVKTASTNEWEAIKDGEGVQVFYQGSPLVRLAVSDLNVPANELDLVCSYLPKKLATDAKFRETFINSYNLTNPTRQ